jgi:hypothetical protein
MTEKKKEAKIMKADPRIHLAELKKAEVKILDKIKELDGQLKLQLTELKITRDLIEESFHDLKEQDIEEFTLASENLNKNIEKLEYVIEEFEEHKKKMNIDNSNVNPYELNANSLNQVTSYDTIERLYDLATKKNWSDKEAQEFVQIKYNVVKALQKEFNPIIDNRLNSVYQAVLHVNDVKPETINYEFRKSSNLEKNINEYSNKFGTEKDLKMNKEYKINTSFDLGKIKLDDKKEDKKYTSDKKV